MLDRVTAMHLKTTPEFLMFASFILGILTAYATPLGQNLFTLLSQLFARAFLLIAPFLVFIILSSAITSLQSGGSGSGGITRFVIGSFISLTFLSSLFSSLVLSVVTLGQASPNAIPLESVSYSAETIFKGLYNPVTVSILLGLLSSYAVSRTDQVHWARRVLKKSYDTVMKGLALFVKIFPLFSFALGATLYHNLGSLALTMYLSSILVLLVLDIPVVVAVLAIAKRYTHESLRALLRYSLRAYAASFAGGGSYIVLPVHLKVFQEDFEVDRTIRDFVLTLGAALNRCGGVIGVLAVTYVVARSLVMQIGWQQMTFLGIIIALIGFASPGIQGGTMIVSLPVLIDVLNLADPTKFAVSALALFIGGAAVVNVGVNTLTTGYIALMTDTLQRKQTHL